MNPTKEKIERAQYELKSVMRLTDQISRELEAAKIEYRQANIELTNVQVGRLIGRCPETVINMRNDGRLKSNKFLDVMDYCNSKTRKKVGV